MELRQTAKRALHKSQIYVGAAAIACLLMVPIARAGESHKAGSVSETSATTVASAASIDADNPTVLRQARKLAREPAVRPPRGHRTVEDYSGRKEVGKASVYAPSFQGHKMADGRRFDQRGHAAASKSLPLGTVAKVTNIQTGRTALVTVEDHGPYVNGRAVDLTVATARQLGITKRQGIAPVVMAPVAIPERDGTVKAGAGAVPGPVTVN